MLRIVVDTNVLVSACIGRGAASKVIEACIEGSATPYLSTALLLEYRDVFSRAPIFKSARMTNTERMLLLQVFVSRCLMRDIHFRWRPNLSDEGDNHLIELAVAASASIIATSNLKDFLNPQLKFPHIEILSPEKLVERLMQ